MTDTRLPLGAMIIDIASGFGYPIRAGTGCAFQSTHRVYFEDLGNEWEWRPR